MIKNISKIAKEIIVSSKNNSFDEFINSNNGKLRIKAYERLYFMNSKDAEQYALDLFNAKKQDLQKLIEKYQDDITANGVATDWEILHKTISNNNIKAPKKINFSELNSLINDEKNLQKMIDIIIKKSKMSKYKQDEIKNEIEDYENGISTAGELYYNIFDNLPIDSTPYIKKLLKV